MQDGKLKKIEEELAGYVKTDRRNWVKIYKLMNEKTLDRLHRG